MFSFFRKKPEDPSQALHGPIHALVQAWMDGQLADLPQDEMPSPEELADDVAQMRDETLARLLPTLRTCDCLRRGVPDDEANTAALRRLEAAYVGLEASTPIFTTLALSKAGQPGHTSGWPLCAIRLVAETWLPQARLQARA